MSTNHVATSLQGNKDAASVELIGTFLLQMARHERDGLSHNLAVLAAASAMGTDPADVLRATGERCA